MFFFVLTKLRKVERYSMGAILSDRVMWIPAEHIKTKILSRSENICAIEYNDKASG